MSLSLRIFLVLLAFSVLARSAEPKWFRVSSDHFIVVTDADQKRAHEIVARFEQMRAVFSELLSRKQVRMGEPIEIFAIATPDKYAQLAPSASAKSPGFCLSGDDRIFIVLNAAEPDSWRAVEYQLARYFLNFNYPPTQPWFDEGFAEYFASLYFTPLKTERGGDPGAPAASLANILNQQNWMNLSDLLQAKAPQQSNDVAHRTLFAAQSWALMHYLISKDKLSETGAYLGLVELKKLPVDQAIQQAFGMSVAQLDQSVKDYFHYLKLPAQSAHQPNAPNPLPVSESLLPFSIDDVSVTSKQLLLPEATALLDEMEIRIPERREQAIQDLQKLASDNRTETAVADRALAWADIAKGQGKDAFETLNDALQLDSSDAWTRYELAQASYHSGEKGARIQGLANMMESLQLVIDRYPDFAEAYDMLGWARLAGGGAHAAMEALKVAVQLAPRNELYQLRLGLADVAGKKWDDGSAIFERLQGSPDAEIAAAAKKGLHDLPFLRKYGIPPQEEAAAKQEAKASSPPTAPDAKVRSDKPKATEESSDNAESTDEDSEISVRQTPVTPQIDKRPVQFLKAAKLISVDCSQTPAAVLTVSKGTKTLKLHTPNYNSLVMMGADKLSCDWKDVQVSVNYRADTEGGGDLVSVEVQ
jgi:tetratricopeptide (TPR) repeat protein